MPWRLTPHGEVDENGYRREAVEAWGQLGIYPPPIVGNPRRAGVVALHRAIERWHNGATQKEQEAGLQEARRVAEQHGWQHNLPTTVSSSS